MPQQPERTGIPPTAPVAGRRAAVTEAKRGEPRADKILKTRHLNLESPARKKTAPPTAPSPPSLFMRFLAAFSRRRRRRRRRRARARSGVQVSKHSRQRGLPARPAVPRRAPAAGRAGAGAGRAPGMRAPAQQLGSAPPAGGGERGAGARR